MSTPRIGPPGSPHVIADATREPSGTERAAQADSNAQPADRLAQPDELKTAQDPLPQQARAFTQPARKSFAERRARGGERGAWTERTRHGILFAADNPEVGRALLDAWNRGVA